MPYIPPTRHVTLLATLRRERSLPVAGEVIVNENQRVEANDVVAHASVPEYHLLLDLAVRLGVPRDKADQYLKRQEGDALKKGDLLASRPTMLGMSKIEERSPVDGFLVLSGEGKVLLAAHSRPLEVRAGLPGVVTSVAAQRGVLVQTVGALLDGAWGNGRDAFSVLAMISDDASAPLVAEQIEPAHKGAIVAGGILADDAPLKPMIEIGVRGLVVGSLPARLIPAIQKAPFPVLVVEGFGLRGLSDPAFVLLSSNSGREVWINARARDRYAGAGPELIIPLASPGQAPSAPADGEPLSEGKRVRLTRGQHIGRTGTVIGLSEGAMAMPSGLRGRAAAVALDQEGGARETVTTPFANLEILE